MLLNLIQRYEVHFSVGPVADVDRLLHGEVQHDVGQFDVSVDDVFLEEVLESPDQFA